MLTALLFTRCGGSAAKVAISDDAHAGDKTYTVLYSTLGYESAATKHILIRQNDPAAPASEGLAFSWRLVDAKGRQAAAGRATFAGHAWGIPLWTADFSHVTAPGTYRMSFEAPDVHLATSPFPIDRFLLFKTTFSSIALANADARRAPIELDNGYFDANGRTGGAVSHSEFLIGLAEAYARRRTALTDAQRTTLLSAIDRAADYLLLIGDPGTGQFQAESPTRPYNDDGVENTVAGLRGLARFAAQFQAEEPEKSDRAYRRAKQSGGWLLANAPAAYTAAMRAAVDYDLYKYSSDDAALLRAIVAVREAAASIDLRAMDRPSGDAMPQFETMYRMWRDLPSNPDRPLWIETARKAAAQYDDMIKRNVFQIVPSGTTDASLGTNAAQQWDSVETDLPPGDGPDGTFGNDWIIARAIDATYLAAMTNDTALEQSATASLAWIGGLNPGVPAARVIGADSVSPRASASFLTGVALPEVKTWSSWGWVRSKRFATIVNGFRGDFTYEDSSQSGETSIKHDGTWLYATSVYEDYLNAGARAPAPVAPPPLASGVHLASVEPSSAGGVLQLLVTVAGADGAPRAGVIAVGAWSGVPLPDHPLHEALLTNTCTTGANGSCLLVLGATELPVRRPISVAVTNLEDAQHPYDVSRDAAKTASFP